MFAHVQGSQLRGAPTLAAVVEVGLTVPAAGTVPAHPSRRRRHTLALAEILELSVLVETAALVAPPLNRDQVVLKPQSLEWAVPEPKPPVNVLYWHSALYHKFEMFAVSWGL